MIDPHPLIHAAVFYRQRIVKLLYTKNNSSSSFLSTLEIIWDKSLVVKSLSYFIMITKHGITNINYLNYVKPSIFGGIQERFYDITLC